MQYSLATAGINFSKPGAHNKVDLCISFLLLRQGKVDKGSAFESISGPAERTVRGESKGRSGVMGGGFTMGRCERGGKEMRNEEGS